MEALRLTLLFVHLLGMAAILGGFLAGLRDHPTVTRIMVGGAIGQVLTGVALVNVRIAQDLDDSHLKSGVKAAIAVALLIVAWRGQGRERPLHFHATGWLAAINVAVAVFWT
jgi:hypothetical protein